MKRIFDIDTKVFSPEEFYAPGEEYYPVYGWFWNGPITDEESEKQILEMQRLNVKAFCIVPEPREFRPNTIPTLFEPGYLTDAYFERYKFVLKRAAELGMKCWIYDEGGWPSGGACGRVMLDHPEYARRTLEKRDITLRAGETYRRGDGVFAAFINRDEMIEDGYTAKRETAIAEYYSKPLAFLVPGKPDVPDVTRPESTDYFIKLTHERYKKFLGEYFGSTVTAVFTDEPMAAPIPFRAELVEDYIKKYGESPLPYLPAILGEVKASGKAREAKIRWFDLASHAFVDNFLLKCKAWSNENGLAFTGHLDRDDEPRGSVFGKSFHIMRGMRAMDVPGIDVIWRQIFPDINGQKYENRFFPRYASSAAAQTGARLALTETFGVYGSGLTFDHMRFIAGFQAIRGVTLFNVMKFTYMLRGPWLSGVLPTFKENYACYRHLGDFNRYLERLSYVMTRGERVTKTALYYPICNFWADIDDETAADEFDALGFRMERLGVDFDILDDDVISASEELSSGVISMGRARYSEIVMPKSALLTEDIKAKLREFELGGGRVIYTADEATRCIELKDGYSDAVASRRTVEGGEIICLFNGAAEKRDISFKERICSSYQIDVTSGRILPLKNTDGMITLTLESGENAAVYLTDGTLPCSADPAYNSALLLDGFGFKRVESLTYGEMYAQSESFDESAHPVKLGCWESEVGRDFSGVCAYSVKFNGVNGDALLDLGDVRHCAEVKLNGKPLGVKLMRPYTFLIKGEDMREENELLILISNTVGNQQHYTKTFDKWASWQLTAYTEKQDVFDLDTLDSGLYGPVNLLF